VRWTLAGVDVVIDPRCKNRPFVASNSAQISGGWRGRARVCAGRAVRVRVARVARAAPLMWIRVDE
jgi:hypothetical protein